MNLHHDARFSLLPNRCRTPPLSFLAPTTKRGFPPPKEGGICKKELIFFGGDGFSNETLCSSIKQDDCDCGRCGVVVVVVVVMIMLECDFCNNDGTFVVVASTRAGEELWTLVLVLPLVRLLALLLLLLLLLLLSRTVVVVVLANPFSAGVGSTRIVVWVGVGGRELFLFLLCC